MKRFLLASMIALSWSLPASLPVWADGCYICNSDSACGQYCRYGGADNADNRKKCIAAGCKIGGTASCPTGKNIKTCSAGLTPLERLFELAALPEERLK